MINCCEVKVGGCGFDNFDDFVVENDDDDVDNRLVEGATLCSDERRTVDLVVGPLAPDMPSQLAIVVSCSKI